LSEGDGWIPWQGAGRGEAEERGWHAVRERSGTEGEAAPGVTLRVGASCFAMFALLPGSLRSIMAMQRIDCRDIAPTCTTTAALNLQIGRSKVNCYGGEIAPPSGKLDGQRLTSRETSNIKNIYFQVVKHHLAYGLAAGKGGLFNYQ